MKKSKQTRRLCQKSDGQFLEYLITLGCLARVSNEARPTAEARLRSIAGKLSEKSRARRRVAGGSVVANTTTPNTVGCQQDSHVRPLTSVVVRDHAEQTGLATAPPAGSIRRQRKVKA